MEQEVKHKELNPRQQAELILNWARNHILYPCGETPQEKAFMQGLHQEAVRKALEEPGIPEALTDEERSEIEQLLEK